MSKWRVAFVAALLATTPVAGRAEVVPPPRPPDLVAAPHSHGSPIDLDIPLPPPRPENIAKPPVPAAPPAPAPPVAESSPRAVPDADRAVCKTLLESGSVVARSVPPIHGAGECGIDAPVILESIVLPDKRLVKFAPTPTVRCDLAAALARWIVEDVDPSLTAQKLVLEKITNADAYSCRGRNNVAGAKLSEHGRGNAIDLDAVFVSPNRRIPLTGPDSVTIAATIRASACARFSTILGPGSDGYHDTHIHLDLEDRRTHGTLCQWRLP